MKQSKLFGQGIMILTLIFMMISTVTAVGIIPSGRVFEYEQGVEHTIPITVLIAKSTTDTIVELGTEGEFASNIIIADRTINIPAGTSEASTTAVLTIPELIKPGEHQSFIVVKESLPEDQGQTVGVVTASTSRIRIRVPYPSKFAETALFVTSGLDKVLATLSASNRGSESISNTQGAVDIFDQQGNKISSLNLDSVTIAPQENVKISAAWNNPQPGSYIARSQLNYDNKQSTANIEFDVGSQKIAIESIEFEDITEGSVVPMRINVKNLWNTEVKDVFGEVLIFDNKNLISNITTNTEALAIGQHLSLSGYWETSQIEYGQYDIQATVRYEEGLETFDGVLIFDGEGARIQEPSKEVAFRESQGGSLLFLIIMLIVIAMSITYFLITRKKQRGKIKE